MPTVVRVGPYRLFFYSNENDEPPHVHVERDNDMAKFWLDPLSLADNDGFSARELSRVREIVEQHREECLEKWNEHFGA